MPQLFWCQVERTLRVVERLVQLLLHFGHVVRHLIVADGLGEVGGPLVEEAKANSVALRVPAFAAQGLDESRVRRGLEHLTELQCENFAGHGLGLLRAVELQAGEGIRHEQHRVFRLGLDGPPVEAERSFGLVTSQETLCLLEPLGSRRRDSGKG